MGHLADQVRAVFCGEIMENEPLARHTSLKVGGPADIFAIPRDITDLQALIQLFDKQQVPLQVIGGGYNLLVRDGGFRGVVISLRNINQLTIRSDGAVIAGAGNRTIELARQVEQHGLTGMEFLVGIPGSVGGAIRMNAGAHGGEIFDHLVSLDILEDNGIRTVEKKCLQFGYRSLQLEPNELIITAVFQLEAGDRRTITETMNSCQRKRWETQRVGFPNAGSFFKNPQGKAAWKLIDEADLRGMTVGGAQISQVHANFLINRGGATARDFLELATRIKEKVYQKSGILLEEEVCIIGED